MENIIAYRIRASYPNYFVLSLFAKEGCELFARDRRNEIDNSHIYKGNKPGTIIYTMPNGDEREIAPLWHDMFYLLKSNREDGLKFLKMLVEEEKAKNDGKEMSSETKEKLDKIRDAFHKRCVDYFNSNPLIDNEYVVTSLNKEQRDEKVVSNKGHMLLELTHQCYAVPDFCIMTSNVFEKGDADFETECLRRTISNLEIMTNSKLGSQDEPLVFAIRSAMPIYIPGLVPTTLNIGVTRDAHKGLIKKYGNYIANRIYLNSLYNMMDLMDIKYRENNEDGQIDIRDQKEKIRQFEDDICSHGGERLIEDAFYQVVEIVKFIKSFYSNNHELIMTFMQGRSALPAFIFQKMVWTIGSNNSYPGVLYSRNSRNGIGIQIENYPDIFGEEIMTGNISPDDNEYLDRKEIKDRFPAVYHFDPLLSHLERQVKSPVTIEFAVEYDSNKKASLFAVLQLNKSELTGPAAIVAAINMYEKGYIKKEDVINIVHPYHLRQIFSDTIDDASFAELKYFGGGVSVLPRTAVTAIICFNTRRATELKREGYTVCLCKERFTPEDTIVLNEVDAIISLTPAAIHVVTACRGFGIPAFLNLQSQGIVLKENSLINSDGDVVNEGDWITLSSRRQTIFKGKAKFQTARFYKYLHNQPTAMRDDEKGLYERVRVAYMKYQAIVTSSQRNISDIGTLARLISYDLRDEQGTAEVIVNDWYNDNSDKYLEQVLNSQMGSHLEQSKVFNLLSINKKVDFFKNAVSVCQRENRSGLDAGSFMLGRFVSKPLSHTFWDKFTPNELGFILNEYVLYEKYMVVLEEVGETKLIRAHSIIQSEGLGSFNVESFDMYVFIPLMRCEVDWKAVRDEAEKADTYTNNTFLFIDKLSKPINEAFDTELSWKRSMIEDMMKL